MTAALPPPQRRVTLRLATEAAPAPAAVPPPESLDTLFARARAAGLPLHPDPQIAALLCALRLRGDVPPLLYAAAAAVLATLYEAESDDE